MSDCACPHHPFGCFGHPQSCKCANTPAQPFSIPSPRFLPVNVPLPTFGFTILVMDIYGNVTMKTDLMEAPFGKAEP